MQKMNLESISNNTKGIPDCWHIDVTGKSSPEVFQKRFGLPRSMRNDKSILNLAFSREKRLTHFVWCMQHYRNLSLQFMLTGDKSVSPEAHAMARYDEGWHLRNEEDLVEVPKLEEEDLSAKLSELLAVRRHKDYKPQQVKVQALADRANTPVDRAFETLCKCAFETWLKARNDLANWGRMDKVAQELLAEVIFAGFTFFGKAALEDVASIEPEVLEHYRTFRGLKARPPVEPPLAPIEPSAPSVSTAQSDRQYQPIKPDKDGKPSKIQVEQEISAAKLIVAASENAAPQPLAAGAARSATPAPSASAAQASDTTRAASPTEQEGPASLQELYALVSGISEQAKANPHAGPEAGHRIRELLNQHLQRLADLQSRLSPEEVWALIERYCDAVLHLAKALAFEDSDQSDLVPVLRSAWKITVVSALEDGRPKDWFELHLSERQQLPEFVERFEAGQARITAATAEIEEIRQQLVQAKFTARASLKAKEIHKINEINSAHQELETIRVEAAQRLAPEGRTLDDLMEDGTLLQDIEVDVEGFNPQAVQDLQAVLTALTPKEAPAPQAPGIAVTSPPYQEAASEIGADPESLAQPPASVEPQALTRVLTASNVRTALQIEPSPATEIAQAPAVPAVSSQVECEVVEVVTEEQASVELELHPEVAATAESMLTPSSPGPLARGDGVLDVVAEEETAVAGVDEALKHLRWAESRDEAQQAFRIAYDQYSQVPRYIVEAVALHWIEAGHLNVAAQILRDAGESTLVQDRVLDAALLRSAFYGMNLWPKDREALSFTQRDLNLLNHKDLEDQLERKHTGNLVPYLLVCATLQPALFAGSQTQAATLLRLATDHFDDHLSGLVTHTADFSLRGGRVDLDLLRNEQGQQVHLAVAKLQDQVNAWVQVNHERTNRWHALRLALRRCADQPVLAEAIAAIKDGETGDGAAVRRFVDRYASHTESRRLLDDLVVEIRADAPASDRIDSPAYTTFCHQIDALVSIANAWLLEVAPPDMRPRETQDFLRKFHTLLERSIDALENHPRHLDLEHRAGSAILLKALRKLHAEIKSDSHNTWRFDQSDANFHLPETLARLDMGDVGVDLRLEWFAMRLTSPNWLADMLELAQRRQAHWVHLLLLRELEADGNQRGAEIDKVTNDIAGVRAELKKAIEQFRNLSLQAMSVDMDIIGEDEHLANVDFVKDQLEELSDRRPYVDVSDIDTEVQQRVRFMEKLLKSSAALLEEELDRELLSIRVKLGQDAVPEGWEVRARRALDRRSLSLVRELINQLKEYSERNARMVDTPPFDNVELNAFLQVEGALSTLLHEHPNAREAGEKIIQEAPGNLDYAANKTEFKAAIRTLLEWRSEGKNKKAKLGKETYEGIVSVLQFIGLDVVHKAAKEDVLSSCEYTPTGDFRRLKVRISRPPLPKGFPLFEGNIGSSQPLNIIFVQGEWSQAGLIDLIERHGQPDRSVLMVGHPLSPEERKAFAAFCRDRKCTIFLLDPVILSYVATARHQQVMFETFLRVSAAWTFYNPYTKGDARLPAPPEMRFGRDNDIASLVEPRGAALVYGGRQLGKTTLLSAAVQEFKKRDPLHNHAYYMPMDGIFQHVVERGINNVKTRLFEQLVRKLSDDNVLTINPGGSQMDPEDLLRQEFLRPGTTKVLFCLDEIDSVLNKDAATNFELVRSLKALVNDPHHRFRVVLAGLNNVNRFRTYPNVPLEQLGSPLEVGILSSQAARNLILQPLAALGYRFAEPELVDRIMAFTNRHPSLLHIFCSELVEQLGRERTRADGVRPIRQTDIENIENNSDVRRLSGERFDMTLNLDKRYTVAVYGMIAAYDKGCSKFTVSKALEVARTCVPEEFEQMSESGFESILLELVGLGVLRVDDKAKRQYALRNQSILQLIGSMDDIQHKLQQAINGLKDHEQDVLTCHATGSDPDKTPSPLSLQDERMILSAKSPEGAPKYSVSLVMGTPALGLTIKAVQEGFNAINEFQSGSSIAKYETQVINDAATVELKKFSERINIAIDRFASVKPAVVLISLEECSSIDRIVDLISIANETASKATRLKHPLRLVFLMGPRAMWNWHAHSALTDVPNEIGGVVGLNRWTRHACETLLEQQGMSSTPEQGELLRSASEGWYHYVMKFIEARKRKVSASRFEDLSKTFTPLAQLQGTDFEKFVTMSGMNNLPWSLPLGAKLMEFEMLSSFSLSDLQTAIEFMGDEDRDFPITPDQADAVVRWWTTLRVIEVNTKQQSKDADREGEITYSFIPSIQRAIRKGQPTAASATEALA